MNKIYIFLTLISLSLAGCHEVTVGFMKADHAAYPIDSLHIYDTVAIRTEITRLSAMTVNEYDSLVYLRDSLKLYSDDMNREYSFRFMTELRPLQTQLDELLLDSVNHVGEIEQLKVKITQKEAEVNVYYDKYLEAVDRINDIQLKLSTMDPSEGQAEAGVLDRLRDLRVRVGKPIPWTTSEIEGVDGTAPIFYTIAGVRAEKGGDAELFRQQLEIKGGGRLVVPYDFKAPAGYYKVSVAITNEGYSRTIENAFTFIVN